MQILTFSKSSNGNHPPSPALNGSFSSAGINLLLLLAITTDDLQTNDETYKISEYACDERSSVKPVRV